LLHKIIFEGEKYGIGRVFIESYPRKLPLEIRRTFGYVFMNCGLDDQCKKLLRNQYVNFLNLSDFRAICDQLNDDESTMYLGVDNFNGNKENKGKSIEKLIWIECNENNDTVSDFYLSNLLTNIHEKSEYIRNIMMEPYSPDAKELPLDNSCRDNILLIKSQITKVRMELNTLENMIEEMQSY
jgi:hypothetical protein